MKCRIVVTDQVPGLAGGSFVEDSTLWIVVSPGAPDPCHLIADLVHDALGGKLPDTLEYDRDDGGLPPTMNPATLPMRVIPPPQDRRRRSSDRPPQ